MSEPEPESIYSNTAMLSDYLLSPPDHVWRWKWDEDQQEDFVEWATGKTLAFSEEVLDVLSELAEHGLPPLGCILLVLSACREDWAPDSAEMGALVGQWRLLGGEMERADFILQGLAAIHNLDAPQREPVRILQALFAKSLRRLSQEDSRKVVRYLEDNAATELYELSEGTKHQVKPLVTRDDLIGLEEVFKELPPHRLANVLKTGLEDPDALKDSRQELLDLFGRQSKKEQTSPSPAKESDDPEELLEWLTHNEEFAGVASCARKLMALLDLAKPLRDDSLHAFGGVSDITNRGDFDRLLLSELAHDNELLTIRLVNQEALFQRRESPPTDVANTRFVLVDAGIWTWGVTRLFIAALSIALSRKHAETTEIELYLLGGGRAKPFTLDTNEDWMEYLDQLYPDPSPVRGLQIFCQSVEPDEDDEVFLLTHEHSMHGRDFIRWRGEEPEFHFKSASIDAEGKFALREHTPLGSKPLQRATIQLDELVGKRDQKERSPQPLKPPTAGPVFYEQHVAPLYFSIRSSNLTSGGMHDSGACFGRTGDGRLFYWKRFSQGVRLIDPQSPLPLSDKYFFDQRVPDNPTLVLAAATGKGYQFHRYSLDGHCAPQVIELETAKPEVTGVRFDEQGIILISNHMVEIFDQDSGKKIVGLPHQFSVTGDSITDSKGQKYTAGFKDGVWQIFQTNIPDVSDKGLCFKYSKMRLVQSVPKQATLLKNVDSIVRDEEDAIGVINAKGLLRMFRYKPFVGLIKVPRTVTPPYHLGQFDQMKDYRGVSCRYTRLRNGCEVFVDSYGFIHFKREGCAEVTWCMMPERKTVVWSEGDYFGDTDFLWDETVSDNKVLQERMEALFQGE